MSLVFERWTHVLHFEWRLLSSIPIIQNQNLVGDMSVLLRLPLAAVISDSFFTAFG